MRGRRVSRRLIAGVLSGFCLLHGPTALAADAEPASTSAAGAGLRWVARG
jgi:hypothetical protein